MFIGTVCHWYWNFLLIFRPHNQLSGHTEIEQGFAEEILFFKVFETISETIIDCCAKYGNGPNISFTTEFLSILYQ